MPILPGWDSIDGVERWGHFFTILGLIAFAGLVLFEVLAFAYGRREKALVQARGATAALEHQNRAMEDEKTGEREGSAAPIATLQDGLKTAQQTGAKTKEKPADSERRVGELEQDQQPRSLSPDQKANLSKLLVGVNAVHVHFVTPADAEDGISYANDFVDAFREAGWAVSNHDVALGAFNTHIVGIFVRYRSQQSDTGVVAMAVAKAFEQVGLSDLHLETSSQLNEGEIEIVIGNKS